jgi:hypothetical protein
MAAAMKRAERNRYRRQAEGAKLESQLDARVGVIP